MSLSRSLMDSYELGQKIGDDVRSLRETGKNVAQIERESKQDMRNLQHDQFNYRKKNDEIQRKINQGNNVLQYQIIPELERMQKNNAPPEQYVAVNEKYQSQFGEVLSYIFGKNQDGKVNFNIEYSPIEKSPKVSSMMRVTEKNVYDMYPKDTPYRRNLLKRISNNNGSMLAKVNYTEGGRYDIASMEINDYLSEAKKAGYKIESKENLSDFIDLYNVYYKAEEKKVKENPEGEEVKENPEGIFASFASFIKNLVNSNEETTKSAESENLPKFNTEDEALNSDLPKGTKVIVNGRMAVI